MIRMPVLIPKTGTHSVMAAMSSVDRPYIEGHKPARQIREEAGMPIELGASIRRPDERLVSAMNYLWGNNPLVSVDEGLEEIILDATISKVWRTSTWHLDPETRLFPFEGLPILKWLGCTSAPHENASTRRWTVKDLQHHPLWKDALGLYWEDWHLYEAAKQTPGACVWETSGA